MSESTDRDAAVGADGTERTERPVEGIGTYETGEATVFYDTENPLAWLQSGETIQLDEMT